MLYHIAERSHSGEDQEEIEQEMRAIADTGLQGENGKMVCLSYLFFAVPGRLSAVFSDVLSDVAQ